MTEKRLFVITNECPEGPHYFRRVVTASRRLPPENDLIAVCPDHGKKSAFVYFRRVSINEIPSPNPAPKS
ncbi:hypothetical protein M1403_02990 [Patescibacteria group bacterium]|nr:hypothetical protein [Patescibacteria group bacterium]